MKEARLLCVTLCHAAGIESHSEVSNGQEQHSVVASSSEEGWVAVPRVRSKKIDYHNKYNYNPHNARSVSNAPRNDLRLLKLCAPAEGGDCFHEV
jgi:hypothetical protein